MTVRIAVFVLAACLSLGLARADAQGDNPPANPAPASGQTPRNTAAVRAVAGACRADITANCSGVQPGGGRIAQCLRDNAAKLSTGCKDAIISSRQRGSVKGD